MISPSSYAKPACVDGGKKSKCTEERSHRLTIASLLTSNAEDQTGSSQSSPVETTQYNGLPKPLEADSTGLTLQDRQLMIHWCTSAYRSVSWNTSVDPVWHTVVPQEALRHPSLKHGLLALSALHLACTSRADRESHLETAQTHQSKAIMSDLKSLDPPQYALLSTTMTMYSFALSRIRVPTLDTTAVDTLIQIFQRVRDSLRVPTEAVNGVERGEFGPLIPREKVPPIPDTSQFAMQYLWKLNTTLGQNPQHEKDLYDATIQHLSYSFKLFMTANDGTIAASLWVSRIHTRFLTLLQERRPFALVILAHFIVIIHSLRGQWWMGEWNVRVLQELGQSLDAEWRKSISWVMDSTGYYIPTNQ